MIKTHSSGSHFWLNEQPDGVWFCRKGIERMPEGRLHAEHFGYSDSAHFNRAFHRWTGVSPSKYRLQRLASG